MSNELANFVYDRTIDYIENRAQDNQIRYDYASYMSSGNWNNQEMGNVVDAVVAVVGQRLRDARDQREENAMITSAVTNIVDAHAGYVAMSDRKLVDSVDDNTYHSLKKAAGVWEDILNELSGGGRGRGRGQDYRTRDSGVGRRSVFGGNEAVGQRRSVFDSSVRGSESRPAGNGTFGSGAIPVVHRSRVFDEPEAQVEARFPTQRAAFTPTARPFERRDEQQPLRDQREEPTDGPDLSSPRPYDNFWSNGENWQLAHLSKFVWATSAKQQTRRSYDPEQEVRFLVKGIDGTIREEFIPMTDDLTEESHVIRSSTRPHRPRNQLERFDGDVVMPGEDIDAIDLDAAENTYRCAVREFLGEVDINNPFIREKAAYIGSHEEGILSAAGLASKHANDVVSTNAIQGTMMAADPATIKGLEAIGSISPSDSDLLVIQQRLKTLRGTMAENVMAYVDRHFTNEVNSSLRDQFGLGTLSIDSFVEDFEDLVNCGAFKKMGTSYAAQFLQRTKVIMSSLWYMVDSEERLEYLDCGDLLPKSDEDDENYTKFRENVAVLFKPAAYVHVKVNLDKFGMVSSEMRVPQRTGQGADPTMADLLRSLYAIGRKTTGGGRIYMVTADNICVELVAASGARDIIGLRLAV
ncbi:hypothetical protein D9M68_17970 [compost metagenome]